MQSQCLGAGESGQVEEVIFKGKGGVFPNQGLGLGEVPLGNIGEHVDLQVVSPSIVMLLAGVMEVYSVIIPAGIKDDQATHVLVDGVLQVHLVLVEASANSLNVLVNPNAYLLNTQSINFRTLDRIYVYVHLISVSFLKMLLASEPTFCWAASDTFI